MLPGRDCHNGSAFCGAGPDLVRKQRVNGSAGLAEAAAADQPMAAQGYRTLSDAGSTQPGPPMRTFFSRIQGQLSGLVQTAVRGAKRKRGSVRMYPVALSDRNQVP